ncbi:MAG: hypothetical protein DME57_10810 [Verrucomicrobia bacterium]|nr:MAG: hypothetical protein DME57_10810 [Verrucomicrobiota bacterium]
MKKTIVSALIPVLMSISSAFATVMIDPIDPVSDNGAQIEPINPDATDPNSSINLYKSGSTSQTSLTVSPGSVFSLDVYATFTGYTGRGLSYWLQVPTALASHISITSESYFTWTDPSQAGGLTPFNTTTGADSGFTTENRDLGATSQQDFTTNPPTYTQDKPAGTYKVSTLGFSLDPSTPAGTYTIMTTLGGGAGKDSELSDTTDTHHLVSEATFTLTVVPEPTTLSLLGLGGLGSVGLTMLRARRKG